MQCEVVLFFAVLSVILRVIFYMKEYTRKCPGCGKKLKYSGYVSHYNAVKTNSKCRTCASIATGFTGRYATKGGNKGRDNAFYGKKHSPETVKKLKITNRDYTRTEKHKRKISKATSGRKNPMFGRSVYSTWLIKYGKRVADQKEKRWKKRLSRANSGSNNPMFGKPTPNGCGNGWKGWYKGWHFRSLRELAYGKCD